MKARSEIPFGEALQDAWMEHRLEWNTASGRSREREMEEDDEYESAPLKRSRQSEKRSSQKGADKPGRKPETEKKQIYGSTLPGNRHICKAWVIGMCSPKESACPQKRAHV